jgi:hypothetical protein
VFFDSDILFREHKNYGTLIKSWIGGTFTPELCWLATRDGWSSSTFHSKCDNKKPTVTLVKVGSYIFGGYATESWDGMSTVISLLSIISFSEDFILKFRFLKNEDGGLMYMKSNLYIELHFVNFLFQNRIWHH